MSSKGKGKRSGLHSCKSFEHYTPRVLCRAVRQVLGEIDLDPASNPRANRLVWARRIITKEQDGLRTAWHGRRVFLNPPGDSRGLLIKAFWRRANQHVLYDDGSVLWAGYSPGPVNRLFLCKPFEDGTRCPGPFDWTWALLGPSPCTTNSGRVKWINGATMRPGRQPGHWNYVCLLSFDKGERRRFREVFTPLSSYLNVPRQLPRRPQTAESSVDRALSALAELPRSTRALARELGMRTQVACRIVNDLAQRGVVVRSGSVWRAVGDRS